MRYLSGGRSEFTNCRVQICEVMLACQRTLGQLVMSISHHSPTVCLFLFTLPASLVTKTTG